MTLPLDPHAGHDPTLVAAFAADDLAGPEAARAAALVAGCPDCAALAAELGSIAAATRALPAPRRTRDFRLTPEQAASLRPAGLRRFLPALGAPRLIPVRSLGLALATLGVAGLLLSAAPGPLAQILSNVGSAVTPSEGASSYDRGLVPFGPEASPAASPAALGPSPGALGPSPGALGPSPAASGATIDGQKAPPPDESGRSTTGGGAAAGSAGTPWLPLLSVVSLGLGLTLLALHRMTRAP